MYNTKEKKAEYQKRWYESHKAEQVGRVTKRKKEQRKIDQINLFKYLSEHPCVDCGETDVVVLQCDHVRGKKGYDISRMVSVGYPWSAILNELSKCEVRCANDHARRTSAVQKSFRVLLLAEQNLGKHSRRRAA